MRAVTTGIILSLAIACIAAAQQAQAKPRDRQAWPSNPTWAEVSQRARPGEILTLRRIAECEQPGSGSSPHAAKYEPPVRWRTAWGIHGAPARYQGAYGMFSSTYAAGSYVTKYPHPPVATPAQETAVAIVVMRRWGPSAWGCHRG